MADLQSKGDGGDGAVAEVDAPEAAWDFRGVDPADKTRPRLAQDSAKWDLFEHESPGNSCFNDIQWNSDLPNQRCFPAGSPMFNFRQAVKEDHAASTVVGSSRSCGQDMSQNHF